MDFPLKRVKQLSYPVPYLFYFAVIHFDHMVVSLFPSDCVFRLHFGIMQSVLVYFPSSFPPSARSPPLWVQAVCSAQRGHTWRCLGSITHDDTIHARASVRRTGHFQCVTGLSLNFCLGKPFISRLLITSFWYFPAGGYNSDPPLTTAAVLGLDDFPPRVFGPLWL